MGLGLLAAGLVITVQAAGVNVSPLYAKVGPAAFLWLAGGLLIACGATVAYNAPRVEETINEWQGPTITLAGLVAFTLLIEPIGFIAAGTLLFVITAKGLGSRRLIRDFVIGLVVCSAAYALFAIGLGLRLPLGTAFS